MIISTPFDRDGNPSSLSAAEVAEIEAVWQIVAEDYAPFNVDVTTEDPGDLALRYSGTGDSEYGVRIVISPTDEWVGNKFGGVAYVGSFRSNIPAFVFSGNLGNFKSVGDASSHEAGHALGLAHDGTAQSVYYSGHDAWGPIMGNSYSRELAQWSKGEYAGATNIEDDVAVLAATLGHREDDHGDTAAGATLLAGAGETSGFVDANDPVDVFAVDVSGGSVDARVTPTSGVTNLFASITIRNDAGTVMAANTPAALASVANGSGTSPIDWAARATAGVPDGRYTIEIRRGRARRFQRVRLTRRVPPGRGGRISSAPGHRRPGPVHPDRAATSGRHALRIRRKFAPPHRRCPARERGRHGGPPGGCECRGTERHRGRSRQGRVPDGLPVLGDASDDVDRELRGRAATSPTRPSRHSPSTVTCACTRRRRRT